MCEYICGMVLRNDRSLDCIQKWAETFSKNQIRFNKNVSIWIMAMTIYMILNELGNRDRDEEIKRLEKEIERLKNQEKE